MNCRQAKTELALWVGNDLDEPSLHRLERHVAVCPGCRAEREALRDSHTALVALSHAPFSPASSGSPRQPSPRQPSQPLPLRQLPAEEQSVWPAVSLRLAQRSAAARNRRFNGWVPALAVTAACIAVIVVAGRNAAQYTSRPQWLRPPVETMPAVGPPRFDPAVLKGEGGSNAFDARARERDERPRPPRRDAVPFRGEFFEEHAVPRW